MKGSEKLAPLMPSLRRVLRRLGLVRQVELGLQRRRAAQSRLHAFHREINESVSNWLSSSPPMMVMPSGLRSSEPVPLSNASGMAPNKAASVVIMIGRKDRKSTRLNS